MTVAAPLTFPLASLLAEPPGTVRTYDIAGVTIPLPDELRLAGPIEGHVEIGRTNRGVLLRADFDTVIEATCSRCLRDIEVPIEVALDEEVLPTIDLATGAPLDSTTEPDVARLSAHHELDLATLVGEAISLAEPIAPLCEAACPGLCPICGERLSAGHTDHGEDGVDPRLEALRAFKVDEDMESE